MILFEGANVMFGHTVVNVQSLCQLVNVPRLLTDEIDDPSPVQAAPRPGKNIP